MQISYWLIISSSNNYGVQVDIHGTDNGDSSNEEMVHLRVARCGGAICLERAWPENATLDLIICESFGSREPFSLSQTYRRAQSFAL